MGSAFQAALAGFTTVSGWVDIEEEEPDRLASVLAYGEHGMGVGFMSYENSWVWLYIRPNERMNAGRVTHWMSWPDPPKTQRKV
jgi:hypothetical protein